MVRLAARRRDAWSRCVVIEIVAVVIGHWRSGFALLTGLVDRRRASACSSRLFTAIAFGWRVGIAIGVTFGLATWIGMMAVEASQHSRTSTRRRLKKRLLPQSERST